MKQTPSFVTFVLLIIALSACNTLYNTHTVSIEIVVPGKINLPTDYKTIAIRYNNCNVNAQANQYISREETLTDSTDTEVQASKVYFQSALESLQKSSLIDSIVQIQAGNFTNIELIDTLLDLETYNSTLDSKLRSKLLSLKFARFIENGYSHSQSASKSKFLDPEYGLYSEKGIRQIADSTEADILLSFDYFNSVDGMAFLSEQNTGVVKVFPTAYWNVYNLKSEKLELAYENTETISWDEWGTNFRYIKKLLPPRKDAILNAADLAGTEFSEHLSPHWIEVDRMYYGSGQVDLKTVNKFVNDAKFIEAAKIWKSHINNPNKHISAKCMFNMALVCEMEGNLEAAMDWAIKSFYVLGQKNEVHFKNCTDYIKIISQRNLDLKKIELQLNSLIATED
jgi:hypothetical protein